MDVKVAKMPDVATVAATTAAGEASATILSTIVVWAAPHTKIVIGILKSLGYIQFRVDEMEPSLLELGTDLAATTRLIDFHKDLRVRLESKQQQVDDLLARAEALVGAQTARDNALVYAAMADGLGGAWRELMRQLELRGFLLDETRRFFALVERHENAVERTSALIRDTSNAARVNIDDLNLITALEQIKQSFNGLAALTAEAADAGTQVITHVRALGELADNAQRPREIADACINIENAMLRLASLWESVDALWDDERERFARLKSAAASTEPTIELAENAKPGNSRLLEAAAWLDAARQTYATVLSTAGAGSVETRQTAGELKPKVEKRRAEIAADKEVDIAALTQKRDSLLRDFDDFYAILLKKLGHADRLEQFYINSDSILGQLAKMAADLRATDANASMAGELGPLAYQKAGAQIDEGEALLRVDALRADETVHHRVDEKLEALRAALSDVDTLARQRITEAKTVNAKLQAELAALSKWLADGAEAFLSEDRVQFDVQRAACAKFLAEHKKFAGQVDAREPELQAALGHVQSLAASDRRRCAELRRRFDEARDRLEARLALARDFEQFEKFARDVNASLDAAAAQIDVPSAPTGERVRALQQTVREALQREKNYGEKFIAGAKSLDVTDARLQTASARAYVESTIRTHEARLADSMARADIWQSAQAASRRIQTVVEEVLIWERSIESIVRQVEDNLRSYEPSATNAPPTRSEFEMLKEKRTECTRQIVEALERLPQMNRKSCEIRDATFVGDELAEARAFVKRLGDGAVNAREPLARLQTRLQRLREDIREQTTRIETLVIESEQLRAPQIVVHLQDMNVAEGNRVELTAGYDAGQPPASAGVVWLRDDRPLACHPDGRIDFQLGDGRATLHISEARADDAAIYMLRVENVAGAVETSARLTVENQQPAGEKPHFVQPLQNVIATEGQTTVTLDCVLVGSPEPKVIWYKEEECLRESDRVTLRFLDDRCVLEVRNIRATDAGLYKIQAVNVHGESINFCRLNVTPRSPTRLGKALPNLAGCSEPRSDASTVVHTLAGAEGARRPPVFDISLAGQTVYEGNRVLFQAHLAGDCWPAEIAWYLDDERIPNTENEIRAESDPKSGFVRLHIQEAVPRLAGVYAVEASNTAGVARSAAILHLFDATSGAKPSGYYEENNVHNVPGSEAYSHSELIVRKYGGSTAQQRYFYRSEPPFAGTRTSSRSSSAAPSPRPFTQSPYAPSSSRDLGDMGYSSIANAPEFIRPLPTEHTIDEGERVTVDCLLVGNPRPRVHWTFNDRPLKSNSQFVELTNVGDTYTLNFSPARMENAGYYRMCAENVRGRAESLTLLHVRPRSMIPQPIGAAAGRTTRKTQSLEQQRMTEEFGVYGVPRGCVAPATVSARRSVGPPIRHQQPYFSPQQAHYDSGYGVADSVMSTSVYQPKELYSSDYGTRSSSVVRTSTTSMQSGYGRPYYQSQYISQQQQQQHTNELTHRQYDIHVLSSHTAAEAKKQQQQHEEQQSQQERREQQRVEEAKVTAKSGSAPPHFKQTLVSCVVAVGDPAVFDAVVSGVPQPELEWFKDGEPLNNDSRSAQSQIGAEGRFTLRIDSVCSSDAGKYLCAARNASGMATSSAQLVVRPKTTAPDFVKRLISEEVMEGKRLKWSVSIVGDPSPAVVWLRDGQPIPNCDDVRLVQEGPGEFAMIIERVEAADAGQFTCLAENEAGEARSTADLVIRSAGSQPGSYFHITKVTQEKQLKGEEILQNEVICVDDDVPPLDDSKELKL